MFLFLLRSVGYRASYKLNLNISTTFNVINFFLFRNPLDTYKQDNSQFHIETCVKLLFWPESPENLFMRS